jgi:acetyl esterase
MGDTAEAARERLIKKTAWLRRMNDGQKLKKRGKTFGTEMYLDTTAGRLRALGYGFEQEERLPLFIDIHGGGFILGNPEDDDPCLPRVAQEAGVKVLGLEYSLAPEHPFPKAVEECYAAALFATEHADELGIDPERIAMGGHSAGGNFTAAVCLMAAQKGDVALRCVILDYPPLDVYTDATDKPKGRGLMGRVILSPRRSRLFDACYCLEREERKNPLVSPVFATQEQLSTFPPTLVITAGLDSLCAEAERFRDQLIAAGVEVTHTRFEGSPHGFTINADRPDSIEAWTLMIEHLKTWL